MDIMGKLTGTAFRSPSLLGGKWQIFELYPHNSPHYNLLHYERFYGLQNEGRWLNNLMGM